MYSLSARCRQTRGAEPDPSEQSGMAFLLPVNTARLPAAPCIWSACSQAAGLRTDTQHLRLPSSPTQTGWGRHTHTHIYICRLSLLCPSALHRMIPADSGRRVAAGSENKLEQRQVKPSRSHVFLKASIPFSFPAGMFKNSVCLR